MRIDVPEASLRHGFLNEPVGTHTSRTLMLRELRGLLSATSAEADYAGYQAAAVELNAVQKATYATRAKTFRHLRELYALSPEAPVFVALRSLWDTDPGAQPLIAAMCSVARDPVLRSTTERVMQLPVGASIGSADFSAEIAASFPGHYSPGVIARIGRNVGSSWTQAGLLAGRANKRRAQPTASVTSVTYGLLLGYLCGTRGEQLFSTIWARLLDHPEGVLRDHAVAASRQGWLEYRETGGVTEITFNRLCRVAPSDER